MLNLKSIFGYNDTPFNEFLKDNRDRKNISAFGLSDFPKAALSSMTSSALIVTADFFVSKKFYTTLSYLSSGAVLLPAKDDTLTFHKGASGENVLNRFKALYEIAHNRATHVVTTAEALLQLFPDKERFLAHCVTLKKGDDYNLYSLPLMLISAGYRREEQISDIGQFSLRGDILDIWSVKEDFAVRIEFFGDTVESIRKIDMETQYSGENLDFYEVCPFTEVFLSEDEANNAARLIQTDLINKLDADAAVRYRSITSGVAERLLAGDRGFNLGVILPIVKNSTILDFGNFDNIVFDGAKQIYDNINITVSEYAARYTSLYSHGETLNCTLGNIIEPECVLNSKLPKIAFQHIVNANRLFKPDSVIEFKTMEMPKYARSYDVLVSDIKNWASIGYHIYIAAGQDSGAAVRELLSESGISVSIGYDKFESLKSVLNNDIDEKKSKVFMVEDVIDNGAVFHSEKRVIIGMYDIITKPAKKQLKRSKENVFSELKPGDYVVHEFHGIGRFEKVTKLNMTGFDHDYLEIFYAGTDKLYVPVENMECITKYISDAAPVLHKIGGAAFQKAKDRVKAAVKKLAFDLVDLYGDRLNKKGHVYDKDDSLLYDFEKAFGFTETEDQLTAEKEIISDLKSGKIMDRLLCGDVGYGKTEVALRAAFKVICEGKQVAFLSPTTILAAQHFETVKKRMDEFGVNAVRMTRFDSAATQKKNSELISTGKADIAVGTHRLLSKDIVFADLGLLILDEEQRFGVSDKEKIKNFKRDVNVLTLSATPIPRTLHMSMSGIRDISILDTPPAQRLPIQTYVMEESETVLVDAITRELGRQGQVFVVYNRVAKIDIFAARLKKLMPDVRFSVAHGQMDERTLENTLENFIAGGADVLITSTIIENGIDIPRANTMIVMDADKLGLSQLYQLRGRVGRSNVLAYVFFTFDGRKTLTDNALKRLDSITQFTEFGSGFKIAMRDLEIRGAGNIMGAEQHGHMEKVGYEMYCRLLNEAVAEIKGEKVKSRREVKLYVDYPTFIPEDYVRDEKWRIKLYSRISRINDLSSRKKLIEEVTDIYGNPPESLLNLITAAMVKNLAAEVNASGVTLKKSEASLTFSKIIDITADVHENAVKLGGVLVPEIPPKIKFRKNAELTKFLLAFHKNNG